MEQRLIEATTAVLAESGWYGLTLEQVARRAERSRVTLWRQGVTRETLLDAVLDQLATDYRDAMWPVLTAAGSGRDRLLDCSEALFDVLDQHLPLVASDDTVFHRVGTSDRKVDYLEPFTRFLREGRADGTLNVTNRIEDTADVLMNALSWTYVHMRLRHRWSRARARRVVRRIVLDGIMELGDD